MARSLTGARAFAASLSNGAKLLINRRGFAGAAASAGRSVEEKMLRKNKVKVGGDAAPAGSPAANSWIPDPVTGYYRPANRRVEVDAAELRENLLSKK